MKARLRKRIKRILGDLAPAAGAEKSRSVCEALLATDEYRNAGVIMLYIPIHLEVDARKVARAAWQAGKTALAPRVNWQPPDMIARPISSMDELQPQRFGLLEPPDGKPWPIETIDLILVPALAYDRRGNRLGRGGGFYDRFLSKPGLRAVTCGLAFAEQIVREVPVEANDVPVDLIVTDEEVMRFNNSNPRRPGA